MEHCGRELETCGEQRVRDCSLGTSTRTWDRVLLNSVNTLSLTVPSRERSLKLRTVTFEVVRVLRT